MTNYCLSLLLFLISFVGIVQAEEEQQPIKIGVILALTGPVSVIGVPLKNGIVLAKEQLDSQNSIQLIIEDDVFQAKNTVNLANKLLNQDKVQAIIIFGTNQSQAVVPYTEKMKIPLLSLNVDRNVVRNSKYALLLMPSVESLTQSNISEAQKRGYKKVAIVTSQQDACLLQRDIFTASKKFEIVDSQEILPSETDLRQNALRTVNSNPDAVFLSVIPPQGSLYALRLRDLGFNKDIFTGIQVSNLGELKASKGSLSNAWSVSGDDRQAHQYYADYRQRFNDEPIAQSMYAYEAIRLILNGLESGALNHYLHTVPNVAGVAGTYQADGANGYTFQTLAKNFTADGLAYTE